jgi:hypothetical protein
VADGWLSSLLGIHRLRNALGDALPQRSTLQVIGGSLTDDEDGKQSVLDVSGAGVAAHSALTGLAANDHPQYLLATKAAAAQAVWDARVVPAGLHASSDAFTANTFGPGGWTEWDHGGWQTAVINTTARRMELSGTGNGAVRWAGAYKPVPSNQFSFLAMLSFDSEMGVGASGNPFCGLGLFEDAGNPLAKFASYDWERSQGSAVWPLHLRTVTTYDGASFLVSRDFYEQRTYRWLRGRVSINPGIPTTTVFADWSTCGVRWNEHVSAAGTDNVVGTFAAQHFGITYLQLPAVASRVCVEYFRVFDGVSAFSSVPRNGGYLVAA